MKTIKEWLQAKKGTQFTRHGTDIFGDEQVKRILDGQLFVWMDNVVDRNNIYWNIDKFDSDGIHVHLITMSNVDIDKITLPINEIENASFELLDDVSDSL
jgi:hypothetical protein